MISPHLPHPHHHLLNLVVGEPPLPTPTTCTHPFTGHDGRRGCKMTGDLERPGDRQGVSDQAGKSGRLENPAPFPSSFPSFPPPSILQDPGQERKGGIGTGWVWDRWVVGLAGLWLVPSSCLAFSFLAQHCLVPCPCLCAAPFFYALRLAFLSPSRLPNHYSPFVPYICLYFLLSFPLFLLAAFLPK